MYPYYLLMFSAKAVRIAEESVTNPKYCLRLYKVANQQYPGEVMAVQSCNKIQSYPRKLGSQRVVKTHWSALTPANNIVVVPKFRRILSKGVSQNPLMPYFSMRISSASSSSSSTTAAA